MCRRWCRQLSGKTQIQDAETARLRRFPRPAWMPNLDPLAAERSSHTGPRWSEFTRLIWGNEEGDGRIREGWTDSLNLFCVQYFSSSF